MASSSFSFLPTPPQLSLRHLRRSLRRLNLTFLCGFLTLLVLRGTLGAGKFGTPNQDFHHLRQRFRRQPLRVLTELPESGGRDGGSAFPPQEVASRGGEGGSASPPQDATIAMAASSGGDSPSPDAASNDDGGSVYETVAMPGTIMLVVDAAPAGCHESPLLHHKSLRNKVDYCRMHGLEMYYGGVRYPLVPPALIQSEGNDGSGARLMKRLMVRNAHVEWFWWVDLQSAFTNMTYSLQPTPNYHGYNLVFFGADAAAPPPYHGNATYTSFLLRNCNWSLQLLDSLAAAHGGAATAPPPDLPRHIYFENSDGHIYFENSDDLHAFWFENRSAVAATGRKSPLITDFGGGVCEFCATDEATAAEDAGAVAEEGGEEEEDVRAAGEAASLCQERRRRALDEAEEEVLEFYGIHRLAAELGAEGGGAII